MSSASSFISHMSCQAVSYRRRLFAVISLARLKTRVDSLRTRSLSDNSARTRKSQWVNYEHFCTQHGLKAVPASIDTICLYIAYLDERGLEYSTVLNFVHSLSTLHHFRNKTAPNLKYYKIRQALTGLQKLRLFAPNRKQPILPLHLSLIYERIALVSKRLRKVFWVACLISFFTLLRKANIFYSKRNNNYLRRKDMIVNAKHVMLSVRQIKTNRYKQMSVDIPVPYMPTSKLCPASALITCTADQRQPDSALLSYRSKSGEIKALTAERFTALLRKILKHTPYEPQKFSCHSFRRGAATFSSTANISTACLKAQGQWRSSCYQQYVSRDTDLRLAFGQQMAAALLATLRF